MLVAFIIGAALVTPGYSHVSETVSQLGAQGRPHPEVMNTGFIVYGLQINCLAYGLYRWLGRHTGAKMVWLLLGAYGTGVLLSGIFQDDSKALGTPATLEGTLHSVFAMVAFFALVIAMVMFARIVYFYPAWRNIALLSLVIALLNLALSLMFLMEVFGSVEGLLQRFFYVISLVWVEAVSLRCLRLPSSTGAQESPKKSPFISS